MIELRRCEWPTAMPAEVVAFSLGRGGAAATADPYAGDTICDYTGDSPAHVAANRQALAARLGIAPERIVTARQTHSCIARRIGAGTSREELQGIDALVTTERNLLIGINTADCVPILLCDAARGVIAAVHAGWRGTAAGIAGVAVATMLRCGASIDSIYAHIGAAIGLDAYEVGEEVVEALAAAGFSADSFGRRFPSGRWHVDLQRHNALQLERLGIDAARIAFDPRCTYSDPALYSARRQGIASGRNFTALLLR